MFAGGLALLAVATGLYIGARLGPGPRDGLMTGLHARTGWRIWIVRTGIEVTVLTIGWILGGQVGIGTLAFALLIGPMVNVTLPLLTVPIRRPRHPDVEGGDRMIALLSLAARPLGERRHRRRRRARRVPPHPTRRSALSSATQEARIQRSGCGPLDALQVALGEREHRVAHERRARRRRRSSSRTARRRRTSRPRPVK